METITEVPPKKSVFDISIDTMTEEDKQHIGKLLVTIFHLGMKMRGHKYSDYYPLGAQHLEDNKKDAYVLFSSGETILYSKCVQDGLINSMEEVVDEILPLEMVQFSTFLDSCPTVANIYYSQMDTMDLIQYVDMDDCEINRPLFKLIDEVNTGNFSVFVASGIVMRTALYHYNEIFHKPILDINAFDVLQWYN